MRRGLPIVCIFALVQAQAKPAVSIRLDERCLTCVSKQLRGGAASYERNPSYQQAPTLGDVDRDGNYVATATFRSPLQRQRPPPLTRAIVDFFRDLNEYCPTLYRGTLLSALLYALWQFPPSSIFSKTLRNHFVTSSYNVRRKRYHALVLSAFSHAEFRHLALNMYAFFTFGRSVKQTLASQGVELWPFVVTAAVFGNLAFLLFDKGRGGSCIGLSGVTLALLSFDSLVYPMKELRLFVSFFPITLPAYYLFIGLLGFSIMGIFGLTDRTNVAHSTHLGGLCYGALFYETFRRGWIRQWNYKVRKACVAILGT